MAFPTSTQFNVKPVDVQIGLQSFMDTSTTQQHPLGTLAIGEDKGTLAYGQVTCIYLKGVASTAAGDLVVYDAAAGTTTRTVAASRGPLAVALSANVASQYGWYMVVGNAPVSTASAGTGAANALLAVTATAGQATVSGGAGVKVDGAVCKAAQGTPTASFTQVTLTWPAANGNT
jgi:hypothetical protein